MANDVKVVIELIKATPKAGFGVPLLFAGMLTKAVAYTEVSSLEEVVTAGFAETTDVYKTAELLFMQDNAPAKIAVCGGTQNAVATLPSILGEGWRQLLVVGNATGESTIAEISDYIEASGKNAVYFASVDPSEDATLVDDCAGNERTVLIAYKSDDVAYPEAALVGATAGMDAGSYTYKNIILKGVAAQSYTDAEVEKFHKDNKIITYLKKAGSVVTSEGITCSGEYIDIVDSKDYIIEQIEYQGQVLMNRVPKLPFDNRGIASLEAVTLSVLKDAADMGMIAQNDDGDFMYSVTFKPRSECSAIDISARNYNGGSFEFTLAGAIHNAKVHGTIIA